MTYRPILQTYGNPALDAELAYRREVLDGRREDYPEPSRCVVPQPSPAALTGVIGPTTGSVLSEVRATIDAVPRWDDAPLVGRADELGRLMAHVDRAVGGRSSAVLLAGDAGVGKTRLLDELAVRAAERGVRVLTGHCVDLGDVGLPYLPFVDLLRPVAGEPELAPVSSANPVLAGLLAGRAVGRASGATGGRGAATWAGRCRTGPRRSRSTTGGSSCSSRSPH